MKMPKKFIDRVGANLKAYQSVAAAHRARDVSEADTVTVIKDVLADVFGFDKYTELTSEYQVRGTFCDLAIKIDGKVRILVEVKAAAIDLNDTHIRQAVNYGAGEGIEWVALTNSLDWRLYKISFQQPVDFEQVASFKLDEINPKKEEDLAKLFLLAREGLAENALSNFHQQALLFNKYTTAQLVTSEPVLKLIRKEMKRLFPDVNADPDKICDLLLNDVLKREVIEGDKAKEAQQKIKRAANRLAKASGAATSETPAPEIVSGTMQEVKSAVGQ
jgi:hypothetical protein